jgi:wobble nucleotide-excising tRNase
MKIAKCASYPVTAQTMKPLLACNYIFGFNGTGKSTIARLIKDPDHSDFACSLVKWKDNNRLDVYLYNREFIKEHFDDATEMKGVFTLGKDAKDAKEQIRQKQETEGELATEIANLEASRDRAKNELTQLQDSTEKACWESVMPRESAFRGAFEGKMAGKSAFFAGVLRHRGSKAELKDLDYLVGQATTVFGATPQTLDPFPLIDASTIVGYENEEILKTPIVASGNVPIARLVEQMNNSDWLRQGRGFVEKSEGKCPYCQQKLPSDLEEQLEAIFNEEFTRQKNEFDSLVGKYQRAVHDLRDACGRVLATDNPNLDVTAFKGRVDTMDSVCTQNLLTLEKRQAELGRVVELSTLKDILEEMSALVESANTKTSTHNATVADLDNQRASLTEQVWKYVADVQLKVILEKYDTDKKSKEEEVRTNEESMHEATDRKLVVASEIKALQDKVTDVHKVLNDINRLLKSFGFSGFSLKPTADGKGYRVIRPDGKPARESLSEGERSFITFLYFFHLVGGSHDSDGAATKRIVVFDDPVSSMDSEVLFIVSTLVRECCDAALEPSSHIKQVFCFTHNVYFHREVSYGRKAKTRYTYWMVRKPDNESEIRFFGSENPVKSSYQLLWDEIGEKEPSPATVQNNIRRILEYYFQFNGSTDVKRVADKFDDDDPDKKLALAMVSWLHSGSHTIADDVTYSLVDQDTVGKYLRVFRRVFEVESHGNHYEMMCSGDMKAKYEAEKAAIGADEQATRR